MEKPNRVPVFGPVDICSKERVLHGLKSFQWHNLHMNTTVVWIIDNNCPKPKGPFTLPLIDSYCLNVESIDKNYDSYW